MNKYKAFITGITSLLIICIFASAAYAQTTLPTLSIHQDANSATYSLNIQALLLMTMLTLLPAIILTTSAFTRIIIVLAILRQAIGTAQTPSNQILLGLSLFMSFFIMSPVYSLAYENGIKPYMDEKINAEQAFANAIKPLRKFMLSHTRDTDLDMYSSLAKQPQYINEAAIPWNVLIPSYLTSELKTAFQIGFLLFIPFLIIDLVVASVLMSMGMMMLSPLIISLPFKLMLFVLVDGWTLILGSLASSFSV